MGLGGTGTDGLKLQCLSIIVSVDAALQDGVLPISTPRFPIYRRGLPLRLEMACTPTHVKQSGAFWRLGAGRLPPDSLNGKLSEP